MGNLAEHNFMHEILTHKNFWARFSFSCAEISFSCIKMKFSRHDLFMHGTFRTGAPECTSKFENMKIVFAICTYFQLLCE